MIHRANVFLAGAPKCGTTTMAYWLAEHPDCFLPEMKEPSWFSSDIKKREKVKDYDALFAQATDSQSVILDASTDYFYSHEAVENILNYNPKARFIVMLRHPADLLWAWHRQVLFNAIQTEESFEKAFLGQGQAAWGYSPAMVDYRRVAAIGTNLKRIIDAAGRDRVHVILFENLLHDRKQTLTAVYDFLELSHREPKTWDARNVAVNRRSALLARVVAILRAVRQRIPLKKKLGIVNWLNDLNRSKNIAPPDPDIIAKVTLEMADEVALVEDLLGIDLLAWRRSPQSSADDVRRPSA